MGESDEGRNAQGNAEASMSETGSGRPAGTSPFEPSAAGGSMTGTEKTALLERELDEKFAKFDETMLREREAVIREDNAAGNRGFEDRSSFDQGGGDQGVMEPPMPTGGSAGGSLPPGEEENLAMSTSAVPPDLTDASGDDIIARQLREAALKERDPELREKLWDEYRKYKRNQ